MNDTVSRQAVKELAHNQMREKYCGIALKKQRDFYIKLADSIIDLLPSAQVHCEDCRYWDTSWQNDYAPDYHYCPMIDGTRRSDFYCADAERSVTE